MGWNPKRCIPGATITLFACRVLDELRWFGTTGVTHVARVSFPVISASQSAVKRPPLSVTCSLICIVSITFTHPLCLSLPCFSLKCFRLYLSMCLSPSLFFPPSLSLADSWLVWRHQTACIFSAATDGAMAACQRPECSLSQLSGRSPGPKWISYTFGGGGEAFPLPIEVFNCVFWHG